MNLTLMGFFDLVGTIAFAISGAAVGIKKKMDIFGVNMLAITTACGGGFLRDLTIGNIPPAMFRNPFYVIIAAVVANVFFILVYKNGHVPKKLVPAYELMLFCFDTLGLASFAVGGVMVGVNNGYYQNPFLLVFLGFLTGVGGGAIRDIMADQMPDIFVKHIYATAAIAGALTMVLVYEIAGREQESMIIGFCVVIILRLLARHFRWNLPTIR